MNRQININSQARGLCYRTLLLSAVLFISFGSQCPFVPREPYAPEIKRLSVAPDDVNPGATAVLICEAVDLDDDTLHYHWQATYGAISGSGSHITWTAPEQIGDYTITCRVEDGNGQEAMDSVSVEVSPWQVLFIGNSYTGYNKMPKVFKGIATTVGKQITIGEAVIYGRYLDQLCTDPYVIEKINQEKWDAVILQDAGFHLAYPHLSEHQAIPAIIQMEQIIHAHWKYAKIVYFMPWAFKDGITWIPGETDTFTEMQQKIYDRTLELSERLDVIIAPVGWTWNSVFQQRPDIELFDPDLSHPSREGSYLAACVIHCTIFKEPLINVNYTSGLSLDIASYLQTVAAEIVISNLDLWNNN